MREPLDVVAITWWERFEPFYCSA